MSKLDLFEPRFRAYGDVAEFESERELEYFFLDTVLSKLELKLLASQYRCKEGICDILAKGTKDQLIIIELKNTQDSHIIDQVTAYFHALEIERPFYDQLDYSQPIEIYTICPKYNDRVKHTIRYSKLIIKPFIYSLKSHEEGLIFVLLEWLTDKKIISILINSASSTSSILSLHEPPKVFLDLIRKCSEDEGQMARETRDQIYEFAQKTNHKISEKPDGKWLRFEKTKQYPIAEIGWDIKRNSIAIYLWLPFLTINGRINNGRESYKRTSMMKLWVKNGRVEYLAYIKNGRKNWLVVTEDEIKNGSFSKPTKLNKQMRYGNNRYWNGLAMPISFYLEHLNLDKSLSFLSEFVDLSLANSIHRSKKNNSKSLKLEKELEFYGLN